MNRIGIIGIMAFSLCAGCATTATIRTDPPGARVYLRGQYMGTSPVKVKLKDGFADDAGYHVKVEKEGYQTQSAGLQQDWSVGGIVTDILLLVPTLGNSIYIGYFNAKRHREEYFFPLPPARKQQPTGRVTAAR